jgi:hypothetical protein
MPVKQRLQDLEVTLTTGHTDSVTADILLQASLKEHRHD